MSNVAQLEQKENHNLILMTAQGKTQIRIYSALRSLASLPKVSVTCEKKNNSIKKIFVRHEQVYVPDFVFEWCDNQQHYRVYICVASRDSDKVKSGYCVCTIGSGLTAMGFGVLYQFLHKNRANNKESA